MFECKSVDGCLVTGRAVDTVLRLGQHPYADTFVPADQLHRSEPVFPLEVSVCADSGMVQLAYCSDARQRYNLYSYSYTSSNSRTARDHWDECARSIQARVSDPRLVVEIGSNDGYLIAQFLRDGRKCIGIDPSAEMCELARQRGVDTLATLFDTDLAAQLRQDVGSADLVMANNVFNHANDPVNFARAVCEVLSDQGLFVFEVPYWAIMMQSGRFPDMVYHEHPCYFTVKGLWHVLAAAGLTIQNFEVVDYHGGSLRVYAGKQRSGQMPEQVARAIQQETEQGLYSLDFYQRQQASYEQARNRWLANFWQLREQDPDAVVIGVGAAAKANTWLRWHGLDGSMIRWVTDSSPHKQGKYTPLTRIPITGDEVFAQYSSAHALILSWNIGAGLKQAILNINPQTRFISQ